MRVFTLPHKVEHRALRWLPAVCAGEDMVEPALLGKVGHGALAPGPAVPQEGRHSKPLISRGKLPQASCQSCISAYLCGQD